MDLIIRVYSGLNNKLLPLFSLLRIARKENKNVKCLWGPDAYIDKNIYEFLELFKPINDITFINEGEYVKSFYNKDNKIYNKMGSDRDRKEIIYKTNNDMNSVFFNIVHLISYESDNVVGNFVPYPKEPILKTDIIDELREVLTDLIPIDEINEKVNETIKDFNDNVLGIHIRSTDGGFVDVPKYDVLKYIETYLEKNVSSKIYISCDNEELEKIIIDKFQSKILYFKIPFGESYSDKFNRFSYGTKNAVCEMFVLSKCKNFIGTPGSSFSFMTWLLRKDDRLDFWCDNPWK
jgi:hypothetical protein